MKIYALIVAGGRGSRMGASVPKQYLSLKGKTILRHTIDVFYYYPHLSGIQVVINSGDEIFYEKAINSLSLLPPVYGGDSRQESVRKGLESLKNLEPDIVLIHDAARPFVTHALLDRLLDPLLSNQEVGVVPGVKVVDTLKKVSRRYIQETIDRHSLWRVQTPQAFKFQTIYEAHHCLKDKTDLTDDASLCEKLGIPVRMISGDSSNIKITTPEDLKETKMMPDIRVGNGIDVHATEPGEGVIILGCKIPAEFRLVGHSDADVGSHSLTDALLGTLGEGDIGSHFPPSDPQWKGADSTIFLSHAVSLVIQKGGIISHVDITIMGEKPKIAPHRQAMKEKLSHVLGISIDRISVKATTTEKLGFLGRGEGLAALATATVIFS
jgi:2-C-methyl-D-erythritol 4-phosphate cytidylyltransferase/2-C-methyl-D-erythritol 2,4-cyclodiphosphate synthase